MKILIEKAVIEQALKTFEPHAEKYPHIITALREALANPEERGTSRYEGWVEVAEQAEQEPVAWWCCVPGQDPVLLFDEPSDARYPPNYKEPLYTAPVRTKDLTDDEIVDIWNRNFGMIDRCRAVIAADRNKNR